MTTRLTPTESRMLEEVRRWRREVYADDQKPREKRLARDFSELADRFALPIRERDEDRSTRKTKDHS